MCITLVANNYAKFVFSNQNTVINSVPIYRELRLIEVMKISAGNVKQVNLLKVLHILKLWKMCSLFSRKVGIFSYHVTCPLPSFCKKSPANKKFGWPDHGLLAMIICWMTEAVSFCFNLMLNNSGFNMGCQKISYWIALTITIKSLIFVMLLVNLVYVWTTMCILVWKGISICLFVMTVLNVILLSDARICCESVTCICIALV